MARITWNHALGQRIAEARIAKNLAQKDFDALCSVGYLSKIEHGSKAPSPKLLRQLVATLGLDMREFEGAVPRVSPVPEVVVTIDARQDPYAARHAVRERHRSLYDELSPASQRKFDRRSLGSPSDWTEANWKEYLLKLSLADEGDAGEEDDEPYTRIVPEKRIR